MRVDDVAETAASVLADRLRDATSRQRQASLALSGGRTPGPVLAKLAQADVAWERVDVYQVDERIVGPSDPARNLTRLEEVFLSRVAAVPHPMPVDDPDPLAAARAYAADLADRLSVVHLGLGTDGHTASLVPGDPVLEVTDRDVAITHKYRGTRRMTLTYPSLNRAEHIVWIVTGHQKRDVLARLVAGAPDTPAGRVARGHAVVITDVAP